MIVDPIDEDHGYPKINVEDVIPLATDWQNETGFLEETDVVGHVTGRGRGQRDLLADFGKPCAGPFKSFSPEEEEKVPALHVPVAPAPFRTVNPASNDSEKQSGTFTLNSN